MKKIIAATAAILLSSCASILSGTSTQVNVQTSDARSDINATITSKSGAQNVSLPTVITVKKGNKPLLITVKDKCYRDTVYASKPTINLWFLGNVVTGGTFGTSTDAMTGALWTYDEVVVVPVAENGVCNRKK
ncbi:MAG: hypothetical protein LBB09_00645 [Rickettsiales bacterium]|jgi:hypothetical protein|nr:hypothetical protein [Rickettsiales bacterium]